MTVTEERQETAPAKRISAARVLRWVGILGAVSTAMLGVIGSLQEHPHFEIAREVFGNIPDAIVMVFYVVISAFVGLMFFLFARRAEVWQQGQADRRVGQWGERIRRLVNGLAMRTVMRDRRAGIMHSAIYWGFVILFLGTVTVELDHLMPPSMKFLHGNFYLGFSAVLDLASVVFLGGLRSEEHTSELHHVRISYAVFCLKKKTRLHIRCSARTRPRSLRGVDLWPDAGLRPARPLALNNVGFSRQSPRSVAGCLTECRRPWD